MHRAIRLGCAGILAPLMALAAPTRAQGPSQGTKGFLEASVFRATLSGENFATPKLDPAFGFEVGVVISSDAMVHLGGGVQYASHGAGADNESLGMLQFFVEPRLALPTTGRFVPYAGVRLGYVRTSQRLFLFDDNGVEVPGQGVQGGQSYGGTLGVLYKSSHNVRTYASVTFQKLSLGNLSFDGQPIPATKVTGETVVVRAGISLDFSLSDRAPLRPRR